MSSAAVITWPSSHPCARGREGHERFTSSGATSHGRGFFFRCIFSPLRLFFSLCFVLLHYSSRVAQSKPGGIDQPDKHPALRRHTCTRARTHARTHTHTHTHTHSLPLAFVFASMKKRRKKRGDREEGERGRKRAGEKS